MLVYLWSQNQEVVALTKYKVRVVLFSGVQIKHGNKSFSALTVRNMVTVPKRKQGGWGLCSNSGRFAGVQTQWVVFLAVQIELS